MDLKTKTQLVKAVKSFIATIAILFYEEGVRVIKNVAEEWLTARAKKLKTTKKRSKRKKS